MTHISVMDSRSKTGAYILWTRNEDMTMSQTDPYSRGLGIMEGQGRRMTPIAVD
jgi:hypothetical protein